MNFEDNFKNHSSEYIFSNDKFLVRKRKNIFNKIKLKKFDRKNNESLKNLSLSDLSVFNYHYLHLLHFPFAMFFNSFLVFFVHIFTFLILFTFFNFTGSHRMYHYEDTSFFLFR